MEFRIDDVHGEQPGAMVCGRGELLSPKAARAGGRGPSRPCVRLALCCFLLLVCGTSPAADERSDRGPEQEFDWTLQRTSVADLVIGRTLPFRHGAVDLTSEEQDAYVDLLRSVHEREFALPADPKTDRQTRNEWESAFYQFEHARRRAFENGALRIDRAPVSAPVDPFGVPGESPEGNRSLTTAAGGRTYSILDDMMSHPAEFVGRPVVLYGMFHPSGMVELNSRSRFDWEPASWQFQRGVLRSFTGGEALALVDAAGYFNQNSQLEPRDFLASRYEVAVPVMVKGWFVKLWGGQPLIWSAGIRLLDPQPWATLVQRVAVDRQPLDVSERWLFYETLRQMSLTNPELQREIAARERRQRINDLRDEVLLEQKIQTDRLNAERKRVPEASETVEELTRLGRQVAARLQRYARFQRDPAGFPMFVDLFQHPQHWQGRLVTLTGHVRHAVQYAGDAVLFRGEPLHELWLFTDDSQHNPAVIITSRIPEGFPIGASVVDRVTVTGCLMKMYVYHGQEHHRLAPLILCGSVEWDPTDDQIRALAESGDLAPDDDRVRMLTRRSDGATNDIAVLLAGFVAIVIMMTIWGRVQRDRRERRRLLKLIESQPDFDDTRATA